MLHRIFCVCVLGGILLSGPYPAVAQPHERYVWQRPITLEILTCGEPNAIALRRHSGAERSEGARNDARVD